MTESKKISDFTAHELLRFFEGYIIGLRKGIKMDERDEGLLSLEPVAYQASFVATVANQKVQLHGEQHFELEKFLREEIIKLEKEINSKP